MSEGKTKITKGMRVVKLSKSDKLTTEASTPAATLLASEPPMNLGLHSTCSSLNPIPEQVFGHSSLQVTANISRIPNLQ